MRKILSILLLAVLFTGCARQPELTPIVQSSGLKTLLSSQQATLPFSTNGMSWLASCTESLPLLSEQAVNSGLSAVNVPLAAYYRKLYAAQVTACAAFDGVQPNTPRMEPVKGGAPTLVVVTSLSPASSLTWAQSATSQLRTRWVVEQKSPSGSQSGGLNCARSLLKAFLADPTSAPDATCANQTPTLRWITFQQ